jgi:MFS family permease
MNWWKLAPLTLGQMGIIVTITGLISQALQILLDRQGLSVGMIMTTFSLTALISGLLFGKVIDRYGAKKLVLFSLPILLGTIMLYPLAHTTGEYMIVQVLVAIVYSLLVTAFVVLTRMSIPSDPKIQARVNGYRLASNFLGSGLAMYLGLRLVNQPSFWFIVTGIIAGAMILVFWGISLDYDTKMIWRQKKRTLIKSVFFTSLRKTKRLIERDAFLVTLPGMGITACYFAFLTYFALYAGVETAGMILLTSTVANGLVSVTIIPKVVVSKGYPFVMGPSILLLIVSLILIWMDGTFWLLLAAGVMMGFAVAGSAHSISEEIHRRVNPRRLGAGFATSGFLRQLGGVIGTGYSGWMWSILGSNMWISLLPILLTSGILLYWIQSTTHKEKTEPLIDLERRKLFETMYRAASEVATGKTNKISLDARETQEAEHGYITYNTRERLSIIRYYLAVPRISKKYDLEEPEALVLKTKNVALALSLLVVVRNTMEGSHDFQKVIRKLIRMLRRKLTHLLKQIDREQLRDSDLVRFHLGWWDPEDKVQDYQAEIEQANLLLWHSKIPLSDSEFERILRVGSNAKKVQQFLEAVQILRVLEPSQQEILAREIDLLEEAYNNWCKRHQNVSQ